MICAIDTETTGLPLATSHVIELAIVPLTNTFTVAVEHKPLDILINPGRLALDSASKVAMEINGISLARIERDGIPSADVAGYVRGWMAAQEIERIDPLAQNWAFDSGHLQSLLGWVAFSAIFGRHVRDTRRTAQAVCDRAQIEGSPQPFNTSLAALIKFFHLPTQNTHRAIDDAIATAHIYSKLLTNCT